MNRNEILTRARERTIPWDIIVIGGGATGVGCAVDAASRGYDVLLLEQHDFGKGTSSRSTKLIHGGVRYLAQGNISLVREALKERGILLRNTPHVVHKEGFIVPCYSLWQTTYYSLGLKLYDLLSGKHSFGKSRILSKQEVLEHIPTIKTERLSGGIFYYDGQFDDTRLLIDLVKTAHNHGACVLNYAKVTGFLNDGRSSVAGVRFEDQETGESFKARGRCVINATGAYCDAVRMMWDDGSNPIVTLSQGIHLIFDRKFLPSDNAIVIPKTSDGRVLFCIPWNGHTLIGTTDTPINKADLEPAALESEIDFVLETAGEYLAEKPNQSDILSIFTGIRPLVKSSSSKNTASLSRSHTIEINDHGLLTITGGKWTTYRLMAEDAVDQAARLAGLEMRPSITKNLPISGEKNVVPDGSRLHPDLPYTTADVIRAVRIEMARTVEDVLARRTRALFLNAGAAIAAAPKTAEIMSGELAEDQAWCEAQVERFIQTAEKYLPRK